MEALDILKEENINITVINATFIKPVDTELIKELKDNNYDIITVEDNLKQGGLGIKVLDELNKINYKGNLEILAYDDTFIHQGNVNDTYHEFKLDGEGISSLVKKMWRK